MYKKQLISVKFYYICSMKNKTNISQAEEKLLKVGETLTSNVDGNTEPSILDSSNKACVETRREVCIKCGNVIPQTKYKSAKYCSDRCRNAYNSLKSRIKQGLILKPGVGSGGNQEGENNHQWTGKSGSAGCKRAMKKLPKICNRCGSLEDLLAHHIDEDITNNSLDNFEILCKKCHQLHHTENRRDTITGKYIKV